LVDLGRDLMGVKWSKIRDGWASFKKEVLTDNGPRYEDIKEWGHLYFDNPIALFEHNYRVIGYLAGILLAPIFMLMFLAILILSKR
jgi:hypothetical protein